MKTKIKLLSDWNEQEKGAVVEVDGDTATQLITLKIAEEYVEDATPDVENMVKDAVTNALKDFKSNQIALNVSVVKEEKPKMFKSLGEQLIDIANGGKRSKEYMSKALQGQGESSDAAGGYLIQDDLLREVKTHMFSESILAPKCRKIQVGPYSAGVKVPSLSDYTRSGGAVPYTVYNVGEAVEKTKSTLTFEQIQLSLGKKVVLTYCSDELLQDATALESSIFGWVGGAFANQIDYELINGNNAGGQYRGILNAPATIQVARATNSQVDVADVLNMYARMAPSSIGRAEWFVSASTLPQLLTMNISNTAIYFPPNGQAPYGTLLGRPVNVIEHCPALGYTGDVIFADMSQYLMIEKGGIQSDQSIHVRFVYDETAFRFVYRSDAEPLWTAPVTPRAGNTISPFVVLNEGSEYQSSSSSSS